MICVGIARGRHRHVIAEHKFLAENGIRLVELRLDFIQGNVQVKRLLRDRPCPVIATCRRAVDGGHWAGSEEARQLVLRTAIVEGVEYVDLEDDIAGQIRRYGQTKRIVSHHDFERTPGDLGGLQRRLADLDADIVKIATMSNHPSDNLRMLEMVREATVPTIGICMGDIGMPTRVLTGRCGAPFTYATFNEDRLLAPGQVGWRKMRDMFRYDAVGPGTRIFGVVADPVGHSLSAQRLPRLRERRHVRAGTRLAGRAGGLVGRRVREWGHRALDRAGPDLRGLRRRGPRGGRGHHPQGVPRPQQG